MQVSTTILATLRSPLPRCKQVYRWLETNHRTVLAALKETDTTAPFFHYHKLLQMSPPISSACQAPSLTLHQVIISLLNSGRKNRSVSKTSYLLTCYSHRTKRLACPLRLLKSSVAYDANGIAPITPTLKAPDMNVYFHCMKMSEQLRYGCHPEHNVITESDKLK